MSPMAQTFMAPESIAPGQWLTRTALPSAGPPRTSLLPPWLGTRTDFWSFGAITATEAAARRAMFMARERGGRIVGYKSHSHLHLSHSPKQSRRRFQWPRLPRRLVGLSQLL